MGAKGSAASGDKGKSAGGATSKAEQTQKRKARSRRGSEDLEEITLPNPWGDWSDFHIAEWKALIATAQDGLKQRMDRTSKKGRRRRRMRAPERTSESAS